MAIHRSKTDDRASPRATDAATANKSDRSLGQRWVRHQLDHPVRVLLLALLSMVLTAAIAARLTLKTGFESLLPDSRPSVIELHRVAQRTGAGATIFIVLEGKDTAGLRKAADALVPELRALGSPYVTRAEDGVQDVVSFLKPRAGLYGDLGKLEQLRDDVKARYEYEVAEKIGANISTDPKDIPPPITEASIEERFGATVDDPKRFPDGYYQDAQGTAVVVLLRSGVLPSDFAKGPEVIAKIQEVIRRVDPRSFDPDAKWGITGDLAIGLKEYQAINRDLTEVGLTGVVLISAVIILFYLRARMLAVLGATIAVGLAWTFGFTELALGHLNIATGFLFTIIAGNGINFGILIMARYLEARRERVGIGPSIAVAVRETWRATLTAAVAASASYGSLAVTEFRGFREFGMIGGAGMLLCWVATYITLPPLLLVVERAVPDHEARSTWLGRIQRATAEGVPFGRPFAAIVQRAPRSVALAGFALAIGGAFFGVRYARTTPIESDLRQVQSDSRIGAEEQRLIKIAKDITGFVGLDGMAILVDRTDQITPLKTALESVRDGAPDDAKPFKAVHTLQDFVPRIRDEKIPVLRQLKARVVKARKRHAIDDAEWARIEPLLPPDDLRPFAIDDLPDGIARGFTEADGTRGRIMYISPTRDDLLNDSHYLLRWADSFRRTVLPDGSVVLGSGRAVIYADMWAAIIHDIPPAVLMSLGATICVVVLAFRGKRVSFTILVGLLVGICWFAGTLALLHARLNFLNFIALPITFGIGVDYAVNVAARDLTMRDPVRVVRQTGGAVVLCSMTTLLGYLALVRSANFAVRSLGVAAVVGEVTCLLAAVLFLPAALTWWRSATQARSAAPMPAKVSPPV